MLKTTKENPAKPFTPAIVYGVLKGYIQKPALFLLTTAIKFKSFKKRINLKLPKEFINTTAYVAFLYSRLKKIIGKEKAFELIRAILLTNGLALQQANFRTVEAERTFENLKKYQKLTNAEGITSLNTMTINEDTHCKYAYTVTRCVFSELFSYLGVPELTTCICAVDNAIFNCYLPNEVSFFREKGNTIAEGADSCQFVIAKIEKDNKTAF